MPRGAPGAARRRATPSGPAGWRLVAGLAAHVPARAGAGAYAWAWCPNSFEDCLAVAHRLLRQAEEVERAFATVWGAEVLDVVVTGGAKELCATSRVAARVSRKQYEDSWTSAYDSAGNLEAVFNGTCFAASPNECAELVQCSDPHKTFPQEVDPSTGLNRFALEPDAVNHTLWAACQESALAWQLEQGALLSLLALQSGDQSSEQATLLKEQLQEAASEVSDRLLGTTGGVGLAARALQRAQRLAELVDPSTAPAPVDGSGHLPVSLQDLASAIESLAEAAQAVQEAPCSGAATDWATLHGKVVDELTQQAEVSAAVNASSLLDPAGFDYAQRATEAVAVGAAVALQAGALAALAEFNCLARYDPFNAAIRDLSDLQTAAYTLLQRLCAALPLPAVGTAASAPVQECFAERVEAAAAAVQSAADSTSAVQLLSLDFCSRLFNATAYVVAEVSPYTEATPEGADLAFLSTGGEQRRTYAAATGIAYMSPYASFSNRLVDDSTAFASGDKVVQLRGISDGNVHRGGSGPEQDTCTQEQWLTWSAAGAMGSMCDAFDITAYMNGDPCLVAGCYRVTGCDPASRGSYTTDGSTTLPCPTPSPPSSVLWYAEGWPNSSCPFVCIKVDEHPEGGECKSAVDGFFSPVCNNTLESCALPGNVDPSLSRALARFVSPGLGSADGCTMTLAFPLVAGPFMQLLTPPFTVEFWVNVAVDAIPHSSADVPSLAVIVGMFPRWYLALSRASWSMVSVGFYHADITRSSSSREDSIVFSEPISWTQTWKHIAVVVTSSSATSPNVFFYADGELISSAKRSASASVQSLPAVHSDQDGVFHVGPPNMDANMFPEILEEGRTEPYFAMPAGEAFFDALVDEVRVSSIALDGLTQGARLTQLRRRTVCGVPAERLEGSTCLPAVRLTPPYAVTDQSACQEGYEECGARPGMCVPTCGASMLRQPGCSCDCRPGYFQAWLAKALRLSGSGSVGAVTIYDVQHNVVGSAPDGGTLPLRFAFQSAARVALLTVVGAGSAAAVSLEVETAAGMTVPVPEWTSVPLPSGQDLVMHHRRLHELFDPALTCAICPTGSGQEVFASQLPRVDLMACLCGEHFGRDLLGRCVPLEAALQAPQISPSEGFHSPGTLVHLAHSVQDGEVQTPWLLEVRYELGAAGEAAREPSCVSSPVFGGGLDVVRREETTEIRAVLCHPLHYASAVAVATLTGNDHMAPPECLKTGLVSESTDSTWALNVTVELAVSGVPDATIYYALDGVEKIYGGPFVLTTSGQIQTWAKKSGFDDSVTATCSYTIDGEARATVAPVWPQPSAQLGGFVSARQAFLVQRGVGAVEFELGAAVPGAGPLQEPALVQWRAWHSEEPGPWREDVPVRLPVGGSSEAGAEQVLKVECRVKEGGHVWSAPASFKFLVLGHADAPLIQAVPSQTWGVGAQWGEGSAREAALQQVHRVTLERPERSALVYFAVTNGSWDVGGHFLLAVSTSDVPSVAAGGLVEHFEEHHLSSHAPEDVRDQCDPARGPVGMPRLCAYDGEFQVLGGLTVTAFARTSGAFESAAAAERVPLLLEPRRGDPEFQATVLNHGSSIVHVSGDPALKVLPSDAVSLDVQLSYDDEGSAAQTCILASRFRHAGGSVGEAATLDGCSWLEYNGPRSVQLASAAEDAGLGPDESVNVTVLTTVQRAGYLWAYPTGVSFLLLRERAQAPSVSGVQESIGSAKVEAMVWLPGQAAGSSPECYFTVHHEQVSGVLSLAEVPDATTTVADWPSALKATSVRNSAAARETWEQDVGGSCAWGDGKICRLELDETERLPSSLIQTSADLPYVCAWAAVRGYLGSVPRCVRMGAGAVRAQVAPSFVPRSAADAEQAGAAAARAGSLGALGGDAVTLGGGAAEARAGRRASAAGLPVFLNDSLPLQHRYAAVAVDAVDLLAGTPAEQLLEKATFTDLALLESAEVPVTVPLPGGATESDHVLFAVRTRSLEYVLDGVKQWGQESLHFCVALQGQHPPLDVARTGRTLRLRSPRAGSSVLFRWSVGAHAAEPLAAGGGPAVGLEVGFASLQEAYQIRAQVVQHDPNATAPQCALSAGAAGAHEAPVLCRGGESVDAEAPDGGEWVLWAQAHGPGLAPSQAVSVAVEAVCSAPAGVPFAAEAACEEGPAVEHGGVCTPACEAGYVPADPSVQLRCAHGVLTPAAFECRSTACAAPENVLHAVVPSCSGQEIVASGGECVAQCAEGYEPSVARLRCAAGQLHPAAFSCREASSTIMAAAIGAPLVALACLGAGCLYRARAAAWRQKLEELEGQGLVEVDRIQDWLDCVHEVDRDVCVFCGIDPGEVVLEECQHGPLTLARCCLQCEELLRPPGARESGLVRSCSALSEGPAADGAHLPILLRGGDEPQAEPEHTDPKGCDGEAGQPGRRTGSRPWRLESSSSMRGSIVVASPRDAGERPCLRAALRASQGLLMPPAEAQLPLGKPSAMGAQASARSESPAGAGAEPPRQDEEAPEEAAPHAQRHRGVGHRHRRGRRPREAAPLSATE